MAASKQRVGKNSLEKASMPLSHTAVGHNPGSDPAFLHPEKPLKVPNHSLLLCDRRPTEVLFHWLRSLEPVRQRAYYLLTNNKRSVGGSGAGSGLAQPSQT